MTEDHVNVNLSKHDPNLYLAIDDRDGVAWTERCIFPVLLFDSTALVNLNR